MSNRRGAMLGSSLGRRSRRRVVALGGGHGLAASLQALRRVTDSLTAVVGVADDVGDWLVTSGLTAADSVVLRPGEVREGDAVRAAAAAR